MTDFEMARDFFRYDPETGDIFRIKVNKYRPKLLNKKSGYLCNGYLFSWFNKKQVRNHRLAWLLYYGTWPKNEVDHINGIRSDNRIVNLRDVTPRENQSNKDVHRNGKLVGANYHKRHKKYRAQIEIKGKNIYLGFFETELDAHKRYLQALEELL